MGKRTITLTGRRPVTIDTADWPEIAKAEWDSYTGNDYARHVQASAQGELDECTIRVREHADGRRLVYGVYTEGWFSQHQGLTHAGELLAAGNAGSTEAAIGRAGETLGAPAQLVADCIGALPAEEL